MPENTRAIEIYFIEIDDQEYRLFHLAVEFWIEVRYHIVIHFSIVSMVSYKAMKDLCQVCCKPVWNIS